MVWPSSLVTRFNYFLSETRGRRDGMVSGFEDNLYKTASVSEFLDAFIHSSPLFCFSLKNITLGKYINHFWFRDLLINNLFQCLPLTRIIQGQNVDLHAGLRNGGQRPSFRLWAHHLPLSLPVSSQGLSLSGP